MIVAKLTIPEETLVKEVEKELIGNAKLKKKKGARIAVDIMKIL